MELSPAPVSCFVRRNKPGEEQTGEEPVVYSYGCLSRVADEDSVVGVKFGYHEDKAPAIEHPCADVDEVETPETPSSVASFASL